MPAYDFILGNLQARLQPIQASFSALQHDFASHRV